MVRLSVSFCVQIVLHKKVAGFAIFVINDQLKPVCGVDTLHVLLDYLMNDPLIYFIGRGHVVAVEQLDHPAGICRGACVLLCCSFHVTLDLVIDLCVCVAVINQKLFNPLKFSMQSVP